MSSGAKRGSPTMRNRPSTFRTMRASSRRGRQTVLLLAAVAAFAIVAFGANPPPHVGGYEKHGAAFYVATNGNDGWSGNSPTPNRSKTDGPFATVNHALEATRKIHATNGTASK